MEMSTVKHATEEQDTNRHECECSARAVEVRRELRRKFRLGNFVLVQVCNHDHEGDESA